MPKSNSSNSGQAYGPENPHPLSQRKTELVWEGKYDEYGNRRPVKLPASPLPLQRIETIDEPHDRKHAEAQQLGLPFGEEDFSRAAHRDDFRNMLIWGDNKLAMSSLLQQNVILNEVKNLFRGKIDLIYIDPPFDVGADFTMQVQLGDEGDAVQKEQSILEAVAYRDTWGKGTDSYLHMMYERLTLMRDLLSERGSIYVHCDWHLGHALKLVCDDVFSTERFKAEIIWKRTTSHSDASSYGSVHDTIFLYSPISVDINPVSQAYDADYVEAYYRYKDKNGRRFMSADLTGAGSGPARNFGEKGLISPQAGRHWMYDQDGIDKLIREDRIYWTKNGIPRFKKYLDESDGMPASDLWADIQALRSWHKGEDTGYDTQKPESLLERIIRASSNEGDLVADFFCGSGTTLAVAEKLGRRWIGTDLGRYAVHTSRKRLIQVQRELHSAQRTYRSFDVYNLGRYERQWWQLERLRGADKEHRKIVLEFYKAQNLSPSPSPTKRGEQTPGTLLHGKKGSAFVHVDEIDTIFEFEELRAVAQAAQAAGARELHILAWEFEMELALKKQAIEAETNLTIRLKYIPREIMEPNRSEVQFFEAGALQAKVIQTRLIVSKNETGLTGTKNKKSPNPVQSNPVEYDVELVNFIPSLAEAPEAELDALRKRAVKSPFDFIDFWAVDFEYRANKPFEHHWQDFRTRKDRSLRTRTDIGWKYDANEKQFAANQNRSRKICVKVIDVFGVDTTSVLDVEL